MSDAAVQYLLESLKQLVHYDAALIINVREEVDGLTRDLHLLKAVIEVWTETRREDVDLKGLVNRIRAETFEAEDAIDAYIVQATNQKAKKWLPKVLGGIDPASKLRKVAKKVQTIREIVEILAPNPILLKAHQGRDPAGQIRMERRLPDVEKVRSNFIVWNMHESSVNYLYALKKLQ